MSANKLLTEMELIFRECYDIAEKKNHDYAGEEDPLANFRTFGWKGVIVRISDKWQRLVNFFKKQEFKCKDESFEDTIKDAINYLAIALVMYREEKGGPLPGQVNVARDLWLRPKYIVDTDGPTVVTHHQDCTCYHCLKDRGLDNQREV